MINISNENILLIKMIIWLVVIPALYFPIPNILKIISHKKSTKKWQKWLTQHMSHEAYIQKYPSTNNEIICHFCGSNRQGHQLHQALPKSMNFGFMDNKVDSKNTHYLSHHCSRCGSELFRSHHDV
jgi:uncharacterized protein VirK/YbjX